MVYNKNCLMMLKIEVCLMNNQKELEEVWEATKSLEGTVDLWK